jgi:hypothetical protein
MMVKIKDLRAWLARLGREVWQTRHADKDGRPRNNDVIVKSGSSSPPTTAWQNDHKSITTHDFSCQGRIRSNARLFMNREDRAITDTSPGIFTRALGDFPLKHDDMPASFSYSLLEILSK